MPGFGEWVVAARINFTTNGILTMQRLAAASDMANASMLRQAGIIDKNELAMMRYQKRMEAIHAQQIKMGTMVSGMAFVGGAAGLTFAVTEAAKLERAMTGVQIATGASSRDYVKLRAQALEVSGVTAQSAVTIAQEMQRAATTAFHDPKQLMALFPMMAKYADVRYMASGDNPVTSIEKMSQFAHFFAAYSPKDMAHMLDNTARLQFTTHAELNQLVTQGRYFIPNAVKLGVKQDTIFQYLAIMGQLGFLQGKGGTSLNNTILNAMSVTPTTHLSKAKAQGLRDLHMLNPDGTLKFIDAKGNLDLVGMVTHLREIRDIMKQQSPRVGGSNWMRDVGAIFGKQGQVLVSALADNTTAAQMGRNQQAFNRIPGVQGQWKLYSGDLFYQWNAFTTNLRNLFASIALPVLPEAHGVLPRVERRARPARRDDRGASESRFDDLRDRGGHDGRVRYSDASRHLRPDRSDHEPGPRSRRRVACRRRREHRNGRRSRVAGRRWRPWLGRPRPLCRVDYAEVSGFGALIIQSRLTVRRTRRAFRAG